MAYVDYLNFFFSRVVKTFKTPSHFSYAMSFSVTALDVHYLVRELKSLVEEAFIDKVYQSKEDKGEVLIRMRSPKSGKQQLFCKVPDAFFLTDHRFAWPPYPPGFCTLLRKHLLNAQLKSVEQVGFDRVIVLRFVKGPVQWSLLVECFSKGNIVLVNSDNLIRGVMDVQRWKDRQLKVNQPYEFPTPSFDPRTLSFDLLKQRFESSDKELVKFCAASLGLGGKYAEEVVAISGLDKRANQLDDASLQKLLAAVTDLFARDLEPCVCDGIAAPFPLFGATDITPAESFSAAIEGLVVDEKVQGVQDVADSQTNKATSKWQKIIDEQSMKVDGYERAAVDNQAKGELIYEKYQELSSLLDQVNKLKAVGGWSAVKEFIKQKGLPIKVDEKNASLTMDIKN